MKKLIFLSTTFFFLLTHNLAAQDNTTCWCHIYSVVPYYGPNEPPFKHYDRRQTSPKGYQFSGTGNGFDQESFAASYLESKVMPISACDNKVYGQDPQNSKYFLRMRGAIILDQNQLKSDIEQLVSMLQNNLFSYVDKRHKEIKDSLLANINRINQEEMNELLLKNSFLLKKGIVQVVMDSTGIREQLVQLIQKEIDKKAEEEN